MAHRAKKNAARRATLLAEPRSRDDAQKKRLVIGIAAIGIAFLAIVALVNLPGAPTGSRTGLRVGDFAPTFTIRDVDGGTFDLEASRGRPVLLDFMGSRCVTCIAEMPELVATHDRFAPQGLVMISIDVGGSLGTEDPQVAREFLATHGGTWPIALDNQGLGFTYDVRALPTIYVLDAAGRIALAHPGVISATDLARAIEPLLL